MEQDNPLEDVRFQMEHFYATFLAAGDEPLSPESTKCAMALAAAKAAKSISKPIPDWAVEACQMNRDIIEEERKAFERTHNPMSAFRACIEVGLIGDTIPEWVVRYLDRGISNFWSSFVGYKYGGFSDGTSAPNEPAEAFAEAFGIKPYGNKKTGAGTIWSKYADWRWFNVGKDIFEILQRHLLQGQPIKEMAAIFEAAQKHSIEAKTAERDWARFKREYPTEVSIILSELRELRARRRTSDKK